MYPFGPLIACTHGDGEGVDQQQVSPAAERAVAQGLAGEFLIPVAIVRQRHGWFDTRRGQLQQLAVAGEFGLAVTVGQNREIAERTEGSIAKSRQRRSRAGQVNALESRHCTATMPLGRNWDHDKID